MACRRAIAIDQTNPVRSSRSTVGTMTELNDHLKLLFARAGQLFDRQTGQAVRHDSPETIYAELQRRCSTAGDPRIAITFAVELPADTSADEVAQCDIGQRLPKCKPNARWERCAYWMWWLTVSGWATPTKPAPLKPLKSR